MTTVPMSGNQFMKADRIRELVCNHFGVSVENMKSNSRPNCIAWPRQVAMALEYRLTSMSSKEIALRYNKQDHGTVLHAARLVRDRAEAYPSIKAAVEKLEQIVEAESNELA